MCLSKFIFLGYKIVDVAHGIIAATVYASSCMGDDRGLSIMHGWLGIIYEGLGLFNCEMRIWIGGRSMFIECS